MNLNHRAKLATDAHVVSHLAVVIPDKSRVDPDYLFWWSVRYDPRTQAQVTSLPSLKLSILKEARVPLPPLHEQHRIVGILNRASHIEKLRARATDRLQQFIPALFIKMFGDPVTTSKDWNTEILGQLSLVGGGAGFPTHMQGVLNEEIPFLKVSDMNLPGNETRIRSWNNTISESTRQTLRARLFPSNSIIFPKIGAAIATNKKRILTLPSCVDNNVMAVAPGDKLTTEFLYGLMLLKNLSDFASQANPPSIRKTSVEQWRIPLPPMPLQEKYGEIVGKMRTVGELVADSTKGASALSASLMASLLDK